MKRRLTAFLLAVMLVSGSVIFSYEDAYATGAEIVIGGGAVVTVGEAVAFLLGALGLTAASVAVYENVDSIKQWGNEQLELFKAFCSASSEYASLAGDAVEQWFVDVSKGILDRSSAVWSAFKAWVSSLIHGVKNPVSTGIDAYKYEGEAFASYGNIYTSIYESSTPIYYYPYNESSAKYVLLVSSSPITRTLTNHSYSGDKVTVQTYKVETVPAFGSYPDIQLSYCMENTCYPKGVSMDSYKAYEHAGTSSAFAICRIFWDEILNASSSVVSDYTIVDTGTTDIYDRDEAYDNLDFTGTRTDTGVTDIPIDWGQIGSLEIVLPGVIDGTTDIPGILEGAGVIIIDRTTEHVIDREGITDIPVTDVVADVSQISDYTVNGLTELFPFCLPFDLIDFINVLSAEPEAPHFIYTFRYRTLDGWGEYPIEIDLSVFNSVASLMRDMECLAFIIGLIILTRSHMIRG